MLHPVGSLPPAVYWRRRLLALGGLVAVLGGGGWLGVAVVAGGQQPSGPAEAGATSDAPAPTPALERVAPSLAAVQVPTPAPTSASTARDEPVPTGPVSGGPCTDEMLTVEVRSDPPSSPIGSKPTFELVVGNASGVACVRALDEGLQEIILINGAGTRVWGSNDCYPEASSDARTLQPGESVVFPVLWSGLGSEPGCTGVRTAPGPGPYVLRARLDTAVSADVPFTIA